MSSPAKQPAKKGAGGGWGSLFSNTITNLESRLDTILAEDSEASARERAADDARKNASKIQRTNSGRLAPPSKDAAEKGGSREQSRTRGNDRLAERLAKATAAKTPSQAGSAVPSRVGTPAVAESDRASGEEKRSTELVRSIPAIEKPDESEQEDAVKEEDGKTDEHSTLLQSGLPINPARVSMDSSRPSAEFTPDDASSRASVELPNGHPAKSNAELEADLVKMREEHAAAEKQRQEEMLTYMEKIDALQAKLQYLAQETVAAAKEANAPSAAGEDEKKLAEKDERIALLMQEGEKLSKTELRHLQTIKKLRSGKTEDEKATTELKRRLDKVEKSEGDLKARLRKAEVAERQANEKTKQIATIEKQVEELRVDRENAAELVRSLTNQLKEAKQKAEKAEKDAASKASEVDKGKIAALENEVEDAKIEKKLAEDRIASETKKLNEEAEAEKQRSSVRELELKNEIGSLESRLEAMRARVEEGFSTAESGEGSVKLLRQVETLQSQYSLAKENWEAIESSLNSRLAALEKERDEATRREGEVRKKARDAGQRGRRAEEELEAEREKVGALEDEIKAQKEEMKELREELKAMEQSVLDAKSEFERSRRVWETETQQKVEEERAKWQRTPGGRGMGRNGSPETFSASRKVSSAEVSALNSSTRKTGGRLTAQDLSALHTSDLRPSSRRSSHHPTRLSSSAAVGNDASPSPRPGPPSREPSFSTPTSALETPTAGIPPTPSLSIAEGVPDFDDAENPAPDSPDGQRTLNDLLSTSGAPTASASGPSIQLVERLSTTIRRLESEKSTFRDELSRLSSQRDAAREEVVTLMREVEAKREKEGVERELEEVKRRYEASLEMLGEREEEVTELRADVQELKRLYRELADEKTRGK